MRRTRSASLASGADVSGALSTISITMVTALTVVRSVCLVFLAGYSPVYVTVIGGTPVRVRQCSWGHNSILL
jgi:hypothetical protein